jgi:aspartate dehydrogenase
MPNKIGIIGFGSIGSRLFEKIIEDPDLSPAFVFDTDSNKTSGLDASLLPGSFEEIQNRDADLIVEVVSQNWVQEYAPIILTFSDLLIVSVSALAIGELQKKLDAICHKHKTRYFISHGAIVGLDGIRDGCTMIEEVKITTIRPQAGYGLKEKLSQRTILYDGPTRKACRLFPHNVNIHASLALHGLGFDRTHSTVIADPEAVIMKHCIEVKGKGLAWKIDVQGKPMGARNSTYVPESVFQTIKRICSQDYGMRFV